LYFYFFTNILINNKLPFFFNCFYTRIDLCCCQLVHSLFFILYSSFFILLFFYSLFFIFHSLIFHSLIFHSFILHSFILHSFILHSFILHPFILHSSLLLFSALFLSGSSSDALDLQFLICYLIKPCAVKKK